MTRGDKDMQLLIALLLLLSSSFLSSFASEEKLDISTAQTINLSVTQTAELDSQNLSDLLTIDIQSAGLLDLTLITKQLRIQYFLADGNKLILEDTKQAFLLPGIYYIQIISDLSRENLSYQFFAKFTEAKHISKTSSITTLRNYVGNEILFLLKLDESQYVSISQNKIKKPFVIYNSESQALHIKQNFLDESNLLLDKGQYFVHVKAGFPGSAYLHEMTFEFGENDRDVSDDFENAKEISVDSSVEGKIDWLDDVDMYKFNVSHPALMKVHYDENFLLEFEVYDESGNSIENITYSYGPLNEYNLTEGSYYLKVTKHNHSGKVFNYSFNISLDSHLEDDFPNVFYNANKLELDELITGKIDYFGDIDFLKLEILEDGILSIDFAVFGIGNLVMLEITKPAEYYPLLVKQFIGGTHDAESTKVDVFVSAGEYEVSIVQNGSSDLIDYQTTFTLEPGSDGNHSIETAREIQIGELIEERFEYTNDYDYFTINVSELSLLTIKSPDIYGLAFERKYANDTSYSYWDGINWNNLLLEPGMHYLRVSSSQNLGRTEPYQIELNNLESELVELNEQKSIILTPGEKKYVKYVTESYGTVDITYDTLGYANIERLVSYSAEGHSFLGDTNLIPGTYYLAISGYVGLDFKIEFNERKNIIPGKSIDLSMINDDNTLNAYVEVTEYGLWDILLPQDSNVSIDLKQNNGNVSFNTYLDQVTSEIHKEYYLSPGFYDIDVSNIVNISEVSNTFTPISDQENPYAYYQEPIVVGSEIKNHITFANSEHYYRLYIAQDTLVEFNLEGASASFMAEYYSGHIDGHAGIVEINSGDRIQLNLLGGGEYTLSVYGDSQSEYQLSLTEVNTAIIDKNNAINSATVLALNETHHDNFLNFFDTDIYSFIIEEESSVDIELNSSSETNNDLRFYLGQNNINNHYAGYYGFWKTSPFKLNPGVYYLVIESTSGIAGDYDINIKSSEITDDIADNFEQTTLIDLDQDRLLEIPGNFEHLNDMDLYTFELTEKTMIKVRLDEDNSSFKQRWTLFSKELVQIQGESEFGAMILESGTYYLAVKPSGPVGEYVLRINKKIIESIEKDGTIAFELSDESPEKYFTIKLDSPSTVDLYLPWFASDINISLLQTESYTHFYNDFGKSTIDEIDYHKHSYLLDTGTFLFRTSLLDSQNAIDEEILIHITNSNDDIGDHFKEAKLISLDSSGTINIDHASPSDIDMYKVVMPSNGVFEINNAVGESTIELYDVNHNIVESYQCNKTANGKCFFVREDVYFIKIYPDMTNWINPSPLSLVFVSTNINVKTLDLPQELSDQLKNGVYANTYQFTLNEEKLLEIQSDSLGVADWIFDSKFSRIIPKESFSNNESISSKYYLDKGSYYLIASRFYDLSVSNPDNSLQPEINYLIQFKIDSLTTKSTKAERKANHWWINKGKNYQRNVASNDDFQPELVNSIWAETKAERIQTAEYLDLIVENIAIYSLQNFIYGIHDKSLKGLIGRSVEHGKPIWTLSLDSSFSSNSLTYADGALWYLHKSETGIISVRQISPINGNIINDYPIQNIALKDEELFVKDGHVIAHDINHNLVALDLFGEEHQPLVNNDEATLFHGKPVSINDKLYIPTINKVSPFELAILVVDLMDLPAVVTIPIASTDLTSQNVNEFGLIVSDDHNLLFWTENSLSRFNLKDDELVWHKIMTTGKNLVFSNNLIFLSTSQRELLAFAYDSGEESWQIELQGNGEITSMLAMNNAVLVAKKQYTQAIDIDLQQINWDLSIGGKLLYSGGRLYLDYFYATEVMTNGQSAISLSIEESENYYDDLDSEFRIRILNQGQIDFSILELLGNTNYIKFRLDYGSDACFNLSPLLSQNQSCTVIAGYNDYLDSPIIRVFTKSLMNDELSLPRSSSKRLAKSEDSSSSNNKNIFGCSLSTTNNPVMDPSFLLMLLVSIFYIVRKKKISRDYVHARI